MKTRPGPKVRVRLSKGGGAGPARLLNKEHLELPSTAERVLQPGWATPAGGDCGGFQGVEKKASRPRVSVPGLLQCR